MAELGRVQFGDATIEYDVQRSGRRKKTVQITMDGGRVLVAAPSDTPASNLEAIVRKRAPWILRQAPDPVLQASRKRFASGETLPYLGRNVRLIVTPADVPASEVRFDHWSFRIAVPIGLDESKCYDEIRKVVVHWYRLRASQRLPRRSNSGGNAWAGRKRRGADPRPATALGQLRPRRHPPLQLARRNAATGTG